MIIALTSQGASPGVTTLASLLGWLWPASDARRRFVVEADPTGGVIAARWHAAHGLTNEPGLVDLAAAQAHATAVDLASLAQPLADGFAVIPAPPRPEPCGASLRALNERGADALAASDDVVIVDGGRFSPTSPALGLLARAEVVIAVGRPRLEEIQRIPSLAAELRSLRPVVDLVTVGSAPYDPSEMAAHVDLPLLGVVADDPRAADGVRVDGLAGKRLARSDLARSVGAIAGRLAARTALPSSAVAESGGTA